MKNILEYSLTIILCGWNFRSACKIFSQNDLTNATGNGSSASLTTATFSQQFWVYQLISFFKTKPVTIKYETQNSIVLRSGTWTMSTKRQVSMKSSLQRNHRFVTFYKCFHNEGTLLAFPIYDNNGNGNARATNRLR